MDETARHRKQLIHTLHMAYSGEKAAGYAYNAHWKSVKNSEQRKQIQNIESEEWAHREIVGKMLTFLGARPQPARELLMAIIGRTVGFACYLIGWFLPMYFAGRLESANIKEYEVAAIHATALNLPEFATELMRLSSVEKEHEDFFKEMVSNHPFLPAVKTIFKWPANELVILAKPTSDKDI
jgi:rubrerythrin